MYPQWLEPLFVKLTFWGFVGLWMFLSMRAIRSLPMMLAPRQTLGTEDHYVKARDEYLKGRWYEAEALLADCLEVDPRDAPALLLLASVYRHTGRLSAAQQTLDTLGTLETGDFWWLECEIEERRLQAAMDQLTSESKNADIDESDNKEAADESDDAKASTSVLETDADKIAADLAETMQIAGLDSQRD